MLGIKRYKWLSLFISVFLCLGWLAVSAYQGYSAVGINTTGSQERADFFKIRVVDSQTGRGVPLVELKTTYEATYYTDSAGYIAFYEPGLMNKSVFFAVKSHGYTCPTKVNAIPGVTLNIVPGGETVIELDRVNIAERMYRLTGQGIYRDSVLLGINPPLENPVLNARVSGQDSTHAIEYNGRIYWFWGDTAWPEHPLGNFRTTGATSLLPGKGGLNADAGVNYNYFERADGFTKEMVPKLPGDPNLCWIGALMTAPDHTGKERLFAGYASVEGLSPALARGILVFNDEEKSFGERYEFDINHPWKYPTGAATLYEDNGEKYYVMARPWPVVRVKADFDSITDQSQYEAFTCLKSGSKFNDEKTQLDRDKDGNLIWSWKKDTPPLTQNEEYKLYQLGLIKKEEMRFQLWDIDSNKRVENHACSIRWNEHRQKWSLIGTQIWGTSLLGEVWYAEADSITGPWHWAKKIVTHENYSFYNPICHEFFAGEDGRYLYFEGTYTSSFATNDIITPRYEYNQIMYRLDVENPRLEALLNAEIPNEGDPDETPDETPQESETPQETEKPNETEKPQESEKPDETKKPDETEKPDGTPRDQNPDETGKDKSPIPKTFDPIDFYLVLGIVTGFIGALAAILTYRHKRKQV